MAAGVFEDRFEAGNRLAERLTKFASRSDVIVLALPRGGVPVGFEVAKRLSVPLDVFLVRKLGVPGHEELAMGAIASGGTRVLNHDVIRALAIPPDVIDRVAEHEQQELLRREIAYGDDKPFPIIRDKTVILVDDGVATGSTMHAAVRAIRQLSPKEIIVAVPTAPPEICRQFALEVDEAICLITPEPFYGVGLWYREFPQMSDDAVRDLLRQSVERAATPRP